MRQPVASTGAKPKQYVRPVPADWWLKHPAYLRFMLRELSSAFLAAYAVFLLILMARAGDPAAFAALLESLKSPVSVLAHMVALGFALLNSLTTFSLAPRALVVQRGEERIPDAVIAGVHYGAWAVASLVLILVALKG